MAANEQDNEMLRDEDTGRINLTIDTAVAQNRESAAPEDGPGSSHKEQPAYDVVLVHGINQTSCDSWTKDLDETWISKALAGATESKGHVLTWRYRHDFETGTYFTPHGIYREAEALLEALQKSRKPEIEGASRPVYFFSHDIGGCVVKAALSIATDNEAKYTDILHSTRAMYFFGYPHKYTSSDLLEEAILRLLAQECHRWAGNMVRNAKSLAETVIEVNDGFLHTRMLTQAHLVNVVSTLHQDLTQQVFTLYMSTMNVPFEEVVKMEKPHCELTVPGPDASHPVNVIADKDWLMGNMTEEQRIGFRKLLSQASPVFPYGKVDVNWQHQQLMDFPKVRDSLIVHMRCSSGTAEATEGASLFLDNNRVGIFQPLFYMQFESCDERFNNCGAMLRTFLARHAGNRLVTGSFEDKMEYLAREENLDLADLSMMWEIALIIQASKTSIQILGCFDDCDESAIWFLSYIHGFLLRSEICLKILITTTKGSPGDEIITASLSEFPTEHVRSIDYHPEEPAPLSVDTISLRVMEKHQEYIGSDYHDHILELLSLCAGDHDMVGLVTKWLRSDKESITHVHGLLDKPLTPTFVLAEVLGSIPKQLRQWAKTLLSWLLACQRPLRIKELCYISNNARSRVLRDNKRVDKNDNERLILADILRSLRGLVMSVNGEIRFRHPATRSWLNGQQEGVWYHTTETDRHEEVLQTCIDYLNDEHMDADIWARLLPYALEFWPRHWEIAKEKERQLLDLFENESVFQRWAKALIPCPKRQLKLLLSHLKPLPVAAHLGLTTIAEMLLKANPHQVDLRGQALIEASRAGHANIIRLLMTSNPSALEFGDEYLTEAAASVSISGNAEALRELVNRIPMPPNDPLAQRSRAADAENDGMVGDNQQANCSPDSSVDTTRAVDHKSVGPYQSQWLVTLMLRAARLGMDDVISRLLQLGTEPNPPEGTTAGGANYLFNAAPQSHNSCVKLLIDAGANLTGTDENGSTVLLSSITWSTPEMIKLLLRNGASVDEANTDNGFMALNKTANLGAFAALELILSHRNYLEYFDEESNRDRHPVNLAVKDGHKRCLKMLLSYGLSPNICTSSGETALRTAVDNERIDLAEILLENNADPDLAPEGFHTPLIRAISMNNLDLVKLLLKHNATIEKREMPPDGGWSRTPLQLAINWARADIMQYLLEKGADPNVCDSDSIPAVVAAAGGGRSNMVEWLAQANVDVHAASASSGLTALHAAFKHPETVRILLRYGADVNKVNINLNTPLDFAISMNELATVHLLFDESKMKPDLDFYGTRQEIRRAVSLGFTEVVEALLEAGADVNDVNEENKSLLTIALQYNAGSDMVRMILEYNPDLEVGDNLHNRALHHINRGTSLEMVRLIVNAGGKLDAVNNFKVTPLICAIRAQLDDVFSYILKKKPTLINQNYELPGNLFTPLHEACRVGSLTMVRSLIEHQMDVNSRLPGFYTTPLISATLREDVASSGAASEIIALLLVNGADPNAYSDDGCFQCPLMSASFACPADIVQLLLDSNASPNVRDSLNRKPVHLACYNSLGVLNVLDSPDSDFAARDKVGRVPLHYAVLSGDLGLVQVVLERSRRVGVGIDTKDDDGWTPLLWAARGSRVGIRPSVDPVLNPEVISFLLESGADPAARGAGVNRHWTVREVAYYHYAYNIDSLLALKSSNESAGPRRRVTPDFKEINTTRFCDSCLLLQHDGVYYKCSVCSDYDLCYKCYLSAPKLHPAHSTFIEQGGRERDEHDELGEDNLSAMDLGDSDGDIELDLEDEAHYDDFDDEVLG